MNMNPAKILVLVLLLGTTVRAEDIQVSQTQPLREAYAASSPGDVLLIAAGDYDHLFLRGGGGSEEAPVVLRAADPDDPPRFIGGRSSGIQLSGASHVELRDLIITSDSSNALNIDDGGDRDRPARGITLINLTVRGPAEADGNLDGIKLSGLAAFRITDCTITGWGGQGCGIDMVGCHDGLITGSTLDGLDNGHNGIQAKGGSAGIVIRGCTFRRYIERGVNLGGHTGAEFFRPPAFDGYEARDLLVEGCTFVGGNTPVAFVSSRDCTFRYNTVAFPKAWALRILRENNTQGSEPTSHGTYSHNLIVWNSGDLRTHVNIGKGTAPDTFHFEGNWWLSADAPRQSKPTLPTAETDGVHGPELLLVVDPESGEVAVRSQAKEVDAGAEALPIP